MKESNDHEDDLIHPIPLPDQAALTRMLSHMAAVLDLAEGGHPGFDAPG
jgi:hypothetical protein